MVHAASPPALLGIVDPSGLNNSRFRDRSDVVPPGQHTDMPRGGNAPQCRDDHADMTSKPSAVELSRSALERLVLVGDDLAYLTNLPSDRLFSHTEVRLCAGILRRLLVDGQLIAAWRSLGNEPSSLIVETSEIDTALSKWPAHWIKSAWAGGPGGGSQAQHAGLIIGSIPQAEYEQLDSMDSAFSAASLPTTGNRITMPLQTWLKSTAAAINTENMGLIRIKRESVLKY